MEPRRRIKVLDDQVDKYLRSARSGLRAVEGLGELEAVVGVPFTDEDDTVPGVVEAARVGLSRTGHAARSAVICVGESKGTVAADRVSAVPDRPGLPPLRTFLLESGLGGRGWGCRALLDAAARSGAALVLLAPDLVPQERGADEPGLGFAPHWIERLVEAVTTEGRELALARFSRHHLAHATESLVAYPLLAGLYRLRLRQPVPLVLGLSAAGVKALAARTGGWTTETGTYGFDPWLTTEAIAEGLALAEVPLGLASFRHGPGKLKLVFRQVTQVLFEQAVAHAPFWLGRGTAIRAPDVVGPLLEVTPPPYGVEALTLLQRFRLEFFHFEETLFREIVPPALLARMGRLADAGPDRAHLSTAEWIDVLERFLLAFAFAERFHPEDVVDGLFPLFLARLLAVHAESRQLEEQLTRGGTLGFDRARGLAARETERLFSEQADRFASRFGKLTSDWQELDAEARPSPPRLGAWEFVPGVGVVVPQEVQGPGGRRVLAREVHEELSARYRAEALAFFSERLGLVGEPGSREVLEGVHRFFRQLDRQLASDLFPVDLWSLEGASRMSEWVSAATCTVETYQLTERAARDLLVEVPPENLLVRLGHESVRSLLDRLDARDALAMAAWVDRQRYLDRVLDVVEHDGSPAWFHVAPLERMAVDLADLSGADEVRGSAGLYRLAGRVVMSPYSRGRGGDLPTLWFLLRLLKRAVGVELFARVWAELAAEPASFGERLAATVRGHWGRSVTSAHNAFENRHQRLVAQRIGAYATDLLDHDSGKEAAAETLLAAARVYHLSTTLPDGAFVPLSAWTWASYGYRGGAGTPTPLSSLVERDWATQDMLTLYLERAGICEPELVDRTIVQLMAEGREHEDLVQHLPGVSGRPIGLVRSRPRDPSDRLP